KTGCISSETLGAYVRIMHEVICLIFNLFYFVSGFRNPKRTVPYRGEGERVDTVQIEFSHMS
ncbi:MAG: hypothetical protein ACTHXT_12770, partial [Sphingobacterium sp.]